MTDFKNVSMAGLSRFDTSAKKMKHLCSYTPSTNRSMVSNSAEEPNDAKITLLHCHSDSSISMYSLPECSSPTLGKNHSFQEISKNLSQEEIEIHTGSCHHQTLRGGLKKPLMRLSLDMKKVAEVDDTFIVLETDFDEDCQSADEFKERILNTNLIINK